MIFSAVAYLLLEYIEITPSGYDPVIVKRV